MQNTRYQTLDITSQVMHIGYWILDIGCWMLDIGYWILDIGYWMLDMRMSPIVHVNMAQGGDTRRAEVSINLSSL